ncbi:MULTISPECIES: Cof-type HAD-IIB family hydrolase [unclassified Paenibacillus]|uniref:Cof-type HAD-IIB family hydrolase n=1 Tax=unclassified Paenibacillus TaxID=185978 RepID=UPI002406F01C|nr:MULTISPECIES: Cof-type HAD-IIB family hydrolase [unclassified Paenibacillus]MDF9841701.1 Cof subfamily protein (haloacid dehalogenase superfamily) [Paenibacillus sp. PastF-2]MDF9848187.1 Cof subfamily protein (haloacid dehalogenase superfamily) [Paenibacillus sp. PastM-2]MDF9854860.1 Cof subfamily protein (haloacid dehalogenase superfamily) [Paenibacillus sp. PastF-1]MDH6480130.1 Cof subfamily protein (haloacid dehalogenase superfamily) [Paenibacillus sp. PastH-2]MDH6507561.1 Cof subfamily 
MTIKLIAVDMDGTFLNKEMGYDKERFAKQYAKMKEQGIRFVVASGNQYYQLKSFFGEIQDEISYVAENGAFIVDQGQEVSAVDIPKQDVQLVLKELVSNNKFQIVLCGKESAYVLDSVSDTFFTIVNKYYHRLKRVKSFDEVNDQILKFALSCPDEETLQLKDLLQSSIGNTVTPVSSGHGYIDLIAPKFHKASGIQLLQDKWDIKDDETMAFGDGGNDIEMLRHVKYSFAMENGSDEVKEAAKYMAPANINSGVLEVIDQYFAGQGPFKN